MVVNNAGIMKILPFVETSEKDIETMFNVNVLSNVWVIAFRNSQKHCCKLRIQ
jgi:short-subunit dehydrogenase